MVKSLVLHIGDHKTGSTAIQRALAAGAAQPEGVRLFYPRLGSDNHSALARAVKAGPRQAEEMMARFAEQLAGSDADIGVISAEGFEGADPEAVRGHLQRHVPALVEGMRVAAYVRPHAERVLSSHAEQVKIGLVSGTLEEFHQRTLAERRFFYTPRFTAWREVFGAGFVLRPMIRAELQDGDVVRDFLHVALNGAAFGLREMPPANPSLPVADLAVLRAMQMAMAEAPQPRRHAAGWKMAGLLTADPAPGAGKPALHAALAEDIVQVYREDAAALDGAFFDGSPMTRALEAAPGKAAAEPYSLRAEDHFGPDALRLIGAFARLAADLVAASPGVASAGPKKGAGGKTGGQKAPGQKAPGQKGGGRKGAAFAAGPAAGRRRAKARRAAME